MRLTAIIPILLSAAALILSFLCLFAGHKKAFMEDYHIFTLNTSRIGYNLLDTDREDSNPFSDLFYNVTNSISDSINSVVGDTAERLGLDDFYSLHMLDYCYGDYTPAPLANATLSADNISKNVTGCSNGTAMFAWNPTSTIERKLNESGVGVTLDDLNWPDDIQTGLNALKIIQRTSFVLYCISIALIFCALAAATIALFSAGRLSACLNLMLAALAFLAIGLASALVTAVAVKGADVINENGRRIGLEAHRGGKFLAITWAATALMLLALGWWCFEMCFGRRRRERNAYAAKHG